MELAPLVVCVKPVPQRDLPAGRWLSDHPLTKLAANRLPAGDKNEILQQLWLKQDGQHGEALALVLARKGVELLVAQSLCACLRLR